MENDPKTRREPVAGGPSPRTPAPESRPRVGRPRESGAPESR